MSTRTDTILKQCSQCKKEVVISYECPRCALRVCMTCAIKNKWKCPKCDETIV